MTASLAPLIVMASCVAVKCESSGLPSCSRMGEGRDESLKKREKLATAFVESIAGGAAETRKSGARERDRDCPRQSIMSGARERDRDLERARQSMTSLWEEEMSQ